MNNPVDLASARAARKPMQDGGWLGCPNCGGDTWGALATPHGPTVLALVCHDCTTKLDLNAGRVTGASQRRNT